jgi:thiamine transport system permease protein
MGPGLLVAACLIVLAGSVFGVILGLQSEMTPGSSVGAGIAHVLGFTLLQAGLSTVLAMSVGVALAWALSHQRRFPGRGLLVALLSTSMVLPTIVVVLGLVTVFGRNGWLNKLADFANLGIGGAIYGLGGIIIAHVFMDGPFVARGLLQRLEAIPAEHLKLGRSLNLNAWQRFRLIEWPAMATTLPGFSAIVFLLCFTSFPIVLILGGSPKFNTLEVAIYEAIKLEFDLGRAMQLALVQLAVCGGFVMLAAGYRPRDASISTTIARPSWPEPRRTVIFQSAIIGLFLAFFLSPLLSVLIDGLAADLAGLFGDVTFQRALGTSLGVALLSSAVTLACALAIALAKRDLASPLRMAQDRRTRFVSWLLSFSGMLYMAMPALVLGLGFFLIARSIGVDTTRAAPVVVVIANVLIALPFALAILVPAAEKAALRFDRQALSLRLNGVARWRIVEWPLMRAELGFAAALSFCFSFGDLGVIALFGSRDFSTLPWLLYQKMGSYRTTEAAGIALILFVVVLVVFVVVPRLFQGRRYAET